MPESAKGPRSRWLCAWITRCLCPRFCPNGGSWPGPPDTAFPCTAHARGIFRKILTEIGHLATLVLLVKCNQVDERTHRKMGRQLAEVVIDIRLEVVHQDFEHVRVSLHIFAQIQRRGAIKLSPY